MPFTFAHPAIILPLSRSRYFSSVALIIGSITPDFEYFIRMKLSGRYSHSLEGVFLFDLPVTVLLFLIFHWVVKQELIGNLPQYCRVRLYNLLSFRIQGMKGKDWLVFLLSALVGIFSHLFWDSFTHKETIILNTSSWLLGVVKLGQFPQWAVYQYLQHLSTLFGGAFIIWYFHRLNIHPDAYYPNKVRKKYWIAVVTVGVISFAIRASLTFEYYGDVVVTLIASFFIGLIVIGSYKGIEEAIIKGRK